MVYTYMRLSLILKTNEIYFNLLHDTCYHMDELVGKYHAKWNKLDTDKYYVIPHIWGT